jgi:hypothetical protein
MIRQLDKVNDYYAKRLKEFEKNKTSPEGIDISLKPFILLSRKKDKVIFGGTNEFILFELFVLIVINGVLC